MLKEYFRIQITIYPTGNPKTQMIKFYFKMELQSFLKQKLYFFYNKPRESKIN